MATSRKWWSPDGEDRNIVRFCLASTDGYSFLSNMYTSPFKVADVQFHSVEQYFQWSKMIRAGFMVAAARLQAEPDPKKCKALGGKRRTPLTTEQAAAWNDSRVGVMRAGLAAKFMANPELRFLLSSTGDNVLVESLPGRLADRFWGVGKGGVGHNWLGVLLMELRDSLSPNDA